MLTGKSNGCVQRFLLVAIILSVLFTLLLPQVSAAASPPTSIFPCAVYPTAYNPYSMAAADFNGDSFLDLATANESNNDVSVLLNRGDGTFSDTVDYAAGTRPWSIAAADFNGDSYPDLAVANLGDDDVAVLLNNRDGTFGSRSDYSTGTNSRPSGVVTADFNGDGYPDLALTCSGTTKVSVLLNNKDGTFLPRTDFTTGSGNWAIAAADFNGDNYPDLVTANHGFYSNVSVLLNNGSGAFPAKVEYTTGDGANSVTAADFNGDGYPDLVTANTSKTVSVLLNKGDGTFLLNTDYATGNWTSCVAAADFNGDTFPDLAAANQDDHTVSLLFNQGNGTFAAGATCNTGLWPYWIVAADLDNDSYPDLALASNYWIDLVSVLLNNGDGTFDTGAEYAAASAPRAAAAADLNGDAWPDLAVTNMGSAVVSVLLNNGDGTFAPRVDYAVGTTPVSVAAADLNGDTWPDLAVANVNSGSVSILFNKGDGTFNTKVDYYTDSAPQSVAVADFDGDTWPDLAVVHRDGCSVTILLNYGDGTFTFDFEHHYYYISALLSSVAAADFDNDTWPDLVVANQGSFNLNVLFNRDDGSGELVTSSWATPVRADYALGARPLAVAAADLNGDSRPDLVAVNENNTLIVYLNDGDGTFTFSASYATASYPCSLAIADYNGDSYPDLAVANGNSYSAGVLLNNGDGTFEIPRNYAAGHTPGSVAAADFNGDSLPDLAVPNVNAASVSVLPNIFEVPYPAEMTLTAASNQIAADGVSTCVLTATVDDQFGGRVPDNTTVVFHTDHGVLGSSTVTGYTSEGVATATLTSESSPETLIATVTATAGDVSKAVAVFFIPPGGVTIGDCRTEIISNNGSLTGTFTGGEISIEAEGNHALTVATYTGNPGSKYLFDFTGSYYDIHLDNTTGVSRLTVEFCPVDEDTIIYFWNGSVWMACSDQVYAGGCIVVTLTDTTFPTLSDLSGLPFGLVKQRSPTALAAGGEVIPVYPAVLPAVRGVLIALLLLLLLVVLFVRRRYHARR